MKVVTLIENNSDSSELKSEHGLSLYIETPKYKILFDTGQTDAFIHNAKHLQIDLKNIDIVIISHGHYDHIGGLLSFFEINTKAKVYLKKEIFDYHYSALKNLMYKNISYSSHLLNYSNRFHYIDTFTELEDLVFIPYFTKYFKTPMGNSILFRTDNTGLTEHDTFNHELVFAIKLNEKSLIVFTGCAHSGLLNILSSTRNLLQDYSIRAVIGGFHLIDSEYSVETESNEELQDIALGLQKLLGKESWFYTGHCTGKHAFEILTSHCKTIKKINTGTILNF
ncbi:MAG: MBL fold metallo-hydrolase [Bacteroidales bacterium]